MNSTKIIKNKLNFHIPDNIVHELEKFLSDIEVIEGNLAIIRSFALLSLSFFKKLRVIKGIPTEKDASDKDKYGLRVIENQNLQALFTQNVTIEHGRLFFHFNPKLCMNIIEQFKANVVDLRNVSELPTEEVAANSNGDKIACNVTELEVKITKIQSNMVLMELKPLAYEDERQLLGYLIYYMPAPEQSKLNGYRFFFSFVHFFLVVQSFNVLYNT